MKKLLLASTFVIATAGLVAAFATSASAYPSLTTACTSCHSGANVPVTATQTSNVGGTAAYNVSAPTATAIAVFDGTSKLFTFTGTSGTFSVADGKTFTLYAVKGPTTSDGLGSTSISPVAPAPVDTAAPVTTSNALSTYLSTGTIKLSATDNVGVTHTYYRLDGGTQVEGTSVTVTALGSHTLAFWSVDAAGNIEVAKTATFTITAPVPVPDVIAPVTTSNAAATYVSSASIKLSATDNVGVAHTYYVLDGGAQLDGASVTIVVSSVGSHTLTFWSVDAAGNIETATNVTFTITAPVPVVDTTAPVTTSNAKTSYAGTATIDLSATDNVGVAHTYYVLDGGVQVEGTSVTIGAVGPHTLTFWSVDAAGNIEAAKTATFTVTAPAPTPAPGDEHHKRHHHRHHSHHSHHETHRSTHRAIRHSSHRD